MRAYPVVHINETRIAQREAAKALDAGADGIYLIDHINLDPATLFSTFNAVKHANEGAYVGVNMLGYSTESSLSIIDDALRSGELDHPPDALWNDNIRADIILGQAMDLKNTSEQLKAIRLLGGVAFKYTSTFTDDPFLATAEAVELEPYVDVITTSGAGTGFAPSPQKIAAMKSAIRKPLAVASGISIENIDDYGENIDEVLVASSIETESYSGLFDEKKMQTFIKAAHGK